MAPKESAVTTTTDTQNLAEQAAVAYAYTYDPNLFIEARRKTVTSTSSSSSSTTLTQEDDEHANNNNNSSSAIVAGRVYKPNLQVDINDTDSIINAALQIILYDEEVEKEQIPPLLQDEEYKSNLAVNKVVGGMTNSLFRVSNLSPQNQKEYDSILVRVFGAEGMIDRDVETCTFAALADVNIAPQYYGRFANGRIEGWLDNYACLNLPDFQNEETYLEIATKMAGLHSGFMVPDELKEFHDEKEPGLWSQLFSWMRQAQGISVYKTESDNDRASSLLDLDQLEKECHWVKSIVPQDAKVGFCHNDLLPANIMKHSISGDVKFIDFEYGGVNYIAFDIANHFNEWAGGIENDKGQTDYSLFPAEDKQRDFVRTYVQSASGSNDVNEDDLNSMMIEVEVFLLANHLYWGLWAVNQAAIEGTGGFDYLAYGVNRFNRYFETKREDIMN